LWYLSIIQLSSFKIQRNKINSGHISSFRNNFMGDVLSFRRLPILRIRYSDQLTILPTWALSTSSYFLHMQASIMIVSWKMYDGASYLLSTISSMQWGEISIAPSRYILRWQMIAIKAFKIMFYYHRYEQRQGPAYYAHNFNYLLCYAALLKKSTYYAYINAQC